MLWVADQLGDALGHVHQRALVPSAGFQQQHPLAAVGGEAVGQHAARRPGADNDVIVCVLMAALLGVLCHWLVLLLFLLWDEIGVAP
ncbi:hypothetical protein D3C85_1563710 [compost metagenome]